MSAFNPTDLQSPALKVQPAPSVPTINTRAASVSPPVIQPAMPQPKPAAPIAPVVSSVQSAPIMKSPMASLVTPNPSAQMKPIVPAQNIFDRRKREDDTSIAASIYQADPQYKALVDKILPVIKAQDPVDWRSRLPTYSLNRYYKIDPSVKMDKGTAALAATMTQPNPEPAPWNAPANADIAQNGFGFSKDSVAAKILSSLGLGMDSPGGRVLSDIGQGIQSAASGANEAAFRTQGGLVNYAKPGLQPDQNLNPVAGGLSTGWNIAKGAINALAAPLKPVVGGLMGMLADSVQKNPGLLGPIIKAVSPHVEGAANLYNHVRTQYPNLTAGGEGAIGLGVGLPLAMAGAEGTLNKAADLVTSGMPSAAEFGAAGNTLKQAVPGFEPPSAQETADKVTRAVGQITQGKPEEIPAATRALGELDTSKVKTYKDLQQVTQSHYSSLNNAQTEHLAQFPDVHPLEDFSITAGKGANAITTNPVNTAIDHLTELYTKTGDTQALAQLKDFEATIEQQGGATVSQANDLAKEYGLARSGFSDATGQPLTSVNGQLYENTRSSLKSAMRDLLPDDTSKILDSKISDSIRLQNLTEDVQKGLQKIQNKMGERGILESLAGKGAKIIDTATGHSLRGLLQGFLQSNIGNKTMNFQDLENILSKNLGKITDLLGSADEMSKAQLLKAIPAVAGDLGMQEAQNIAPAVPDAAMHSVQSIPNAWTVENTAQALGTTPDKLTAIVKAAGSNLDDIEKALRSNFGTSYDDILKAANTAVDNGDATMGALDIADPLRKTIFGAKTITEQAGQAAAELSNKAIPDDVAATAPKGLVKLDTQLNEWRLVPSAISPKNKQAIKWLLAAAATSVAANKVVK